MPQFTQTEINAIREMVACHLTTSSKLTDYSTKCQDQQVKQMFNQAAQEAKKSAQNLINML